MYKKIEIKGFIKKNIFWRVKKLKNDFFDKKLLSPTRGIKEENPDIIKSFRNFRFLYVCTFDKSFKFVVKHF